MPELKGLLASAKRKIGGLLGDFPQGFNAGAVAGVAGYPGDIAYMLDTAGRAVTGQETMPAAQDFFGTTDYLAAKAGYPIPQSFSGQLGAAVGGLLSPGPGDLARLAPVLSAIPFWHGSPHKYDAVDLSKIGTGEGAQAYGWGYYGADAPDTALSYKNALSGDQGFYLDGRGPLTRQEVQNIVNGEESKYLDGVTRPSGVADMVMDEKSYGWVPNKPPKRYKDGSERLLAYEALKQRIEHPDNGHLYRGEYVWPDPAKEAATPLTGEDLLDWDRPLSEQSEKVKRAILDAGTPGKWGTGSSGERRFLNAPDYHTPSGEAAYKRLSEIFGSDKAATDYLNSLGIPGIRYLDQVSRPNLEDALRGVRRGQEKVASLEAKYADSPTEALANKLSDAKQELQSAQRAVGDLTYNYVFFNEKGINLLERNGEPINAAQDFAARRAGKAKPYKEFDLGEWAKGTRVSSQDGEPVVMYHGTTHDIEEFKPGTFFTANPQRASGYTETKSGKTDGGTVYPTLINMRKPIKVYGQETSQIPGAGFIVGDELAGKYENNITAADFAYDENLMRIAKEKGYDGVLVLDDYRTNNPVTAIPFNSEQVRFAAGYGQKRRGK